MKLSFILFSFFFSVILPFKKKYAYSSSLYQNQFTASIRDQYQNQENLESKIKRCFDEKVNQAWTGERGYIAVIVYKDRMDFWNTNCELVNKISFGVPYIRADQNIYRFSGQLNKLNHCYSDSPGEKPYEVTFYLEDVNEYDGFEYQSITRVVMYRKVYQPPNSNKEEGTIKRFVYDDWEVPYFHYNTFDKNVYDSKCGMYSF